METSREEVRASLTFGGDWLRAARVWIQWNVPMGDQLQWGSNQPVTLSVAQLEEFALEVATIAVESDRENKSRYNGNATIQR